MAQDFKFKPQIQFADLEGHLNQVPFVCSKFGSNQNLGLKFKVFFRCLDRRMQTFSCLLSVPIAEVTEENRPIDYWVENSKALTSSDFDH